MEIASTSPIAMRTIASAVSTTKRIAREMAPLLCMGAAIASLARPATTPSHAIIFDLALVKCQRQEILVSC